MAKNWIKSAIKHPGALHKSLGVPAGKKIPDATINEKIAAIKKKEKGGKKLSVSDRLLMKRLSLAKTLKGMN